jgi:squalene-hopene/tetraprenyl-beta-curcumene cyclase
MHFMDIGIPPSRLKRIVSAVKGKQNADGSWSAYYGGPGDVSVTSQVYFALKLARVSHEEEFMCRARDFVIGRGGVMKANLITRIWLALFGEFDWKGIPTIPPEIIFLPSWFYFNIYECSSWARATIMALAILATEKPVCRVPDHAHVSELYAEPERDRIYSVGKAPGLLSWEAFFLLVDRFLKTYQKLPVRPLRGLALRKTADWIINHQEADGSWGGIMLPWVYSLFALKCLGYQNDHPVVRRGIEGLEGFIVEDEDSFLLEPAVSPVWDTAWAVLALRGSGLPGNHTSLTKAAGWLLKHEIRTQGDWKIKNPRTQAGCWAFEFENRNYPDIDDTSVVPRALNSVKLPTAGEEAVRSEAIQRGISWVISMQGDNGGWAAFDRNNNRRMLAHIPFSDFMTPLDPGSPDVTNHAIELLSQFPGEYRKPIERALVYLKKNQEKDGAWYGRWGVNYIYGTGLVLPSLKSAGEDMQQEYVRQAVGWLKAHQNPDGGWGETCRSYEEPDSRGRGESTASQTAWALIGLLAAGEVSSAGVLQGIDYLLRTQRDDGSWPEQAFTGTGFPRAFYLRYELYKIYFPLMALARYKIAMEGVQ